MKKIGFYKLFYVFFIGSILGYIVEGIYVFLIHNKFNFINHTTFVIGPLNIVYGMGAVILTLLLYKYKDQEYWKIFLISFICGALIEFISSYTTEFMIGVSTWNYSNKFLNLDGRICLENTIHWGFLGLVWIKLFFPIIENVVDNLNNKFGRILTCFFIAFLIMDASLTLSAIDRAKQKDKGIEAQNSFEVFLDNNFNKDYLKQMFNNHIWE